MSKRIVIVGAGSSGCVIAARASENPDIEVTLLEAGPDYFPGEIPGDLSNGGRNSFVAHDWSYTHRPTAPQLVFPLPRGRVVGGSSAVNTCIAVRGEPEDFDEWAALGLDDWTWKQCLPAFRRLERDQDFDDEWHGRSGPLPIRRHPESEWTPWQRAFVDACLSLGHSQSPDINRPGQAGTGPHAMNKIAGRRISAAEAWLTPEVRVRPNLTVVADTHAVRVPLQDGRALGVEVVRGGRIQTHFADEVVLCAGAIATPGLLLRSGIGDEADLRQMGVPTKVVNEHVGRELLDHPGMAIFFRPNLSAGTSTEHDLIQTYCRVPSGATRLTNDIIVQPGACVPTPWGTFPLVSLMFSIGKPKGVGRMRWESANPHYRPRIESAFLEHPADLEVALNMIEILLEIGDRPATRKIARPFWPRPHTVRSRRRMAKKVFKICDSGYHPCGTVPMGASDDFLCDGRGRVRGVSGLRVADASLMPTIPTANIHLSVLMMAERIAEWVRDGDS